MAANGVATNGVAANGVATNGVVATGQLAGFRLGPVATAAVFLRGAKQAVGLARSDTLAAQSTARRIGIGRLISGGLMVVRPTFAPGLIGVPVRGSVQGQWLPRLLAAREAATG